MNYTPKQIDQMLKLARASIKQHLEKGTFYEINKPEDWMLEHRATFVTLKIKGQLRGCIGHLIAMLPLYKDIIDNSVSAAFEDPRFDSLTKKEFEATKIEISVLTPPELLAYTDTADLLAKLNSKQGVILSKGRYSATFLPQVWQELPDKKEFLSHLCLKAGLSATEWMNKPNIQVYEVDAFEEK
jgi:AmmeMemoRadiSam system protein A